MRTYYRNPKTNQLISFDSEKNEVVEMQEVWSIKNEVLTACEVKKIEKIITSKKPTKKEVKGKKTCSICGKQGHIAKTCSEKKKVPTLQEALGIEEPTKKRADEDDITRILHLKAVGKKSLEIAKELGLPLSEVNKHWLDEIE